MSDDRADQELVEIADFLQRELAADGFDAAVDDMLRHAALASQRGEK